MPVKKLAFFWGFVPHSIVEMVSHSAVRSDLCVNVATLFLVEIDLCLENVDLLGLFFKLGSKFELLLLDGKLIFIVFMFVKDLLVSAIQLFVKLGRFGALLFDHVKKSSVALDGLGELSLSLG